MAAVAHDGQAGMDAGADGVEFEAQRDLGDQPRRRPVLAEADGRRGDRLVHGRLSSKTAPYLVTALDLVMRATQGAAMHLLIFGLGYTAGRLARRLTADGWQVTATSRSGADGTVALDSREVVTAIATTTHVLSSVPPADGVDPVLARHAAALAASPARWVGYLSSTGVYGDSGGAWIDESAPLGGRRHERVAADRAWAALRPDVRIFRLPGIYGPGRSAVDQVRAGTARRVDAPGHRFSRIHVDDIVAALCLSFDHGPPGIYNLADETPAEGRHVVEYACDLLGGPYPPLILPAALPPVARGFYSERRVVAAGKARRLLGFAPRFADYRAGLRACL